MIIPTSEGRLIEVREGSLSTPPEPIVIRGPLKTPRVNRGGKPKGNPENAPIFTALKAIPGYAAWHGRRAAETSVLNGNNGRQFGQADGYSRKKASIAYRKGVAQAKRDMEELKKTINFEDSVAEEAMKGVVEVLRTPNSQALKLQAARLLLDFTKSKPASKSDVTINTAEQFLDSLHDPTAEDGA